MESKNKFFATIVTAIMLFSFISLSAMLPVRATTPVGLPYTCNSTVSYYTGSFNYCTITLVSGWNLISLPVVPNSTVITAAQLKNKAYVQYFAGAANTIGNLFTKEGLPELAHSPTVAVWTYNAKTATWLFCTLTATTDCSASSTLKTMVDGAAYWVLTTSPVTLMVGGWVIVPQMVPPSYTLYKGWNLVGFKPQPTIASEYASAYFSSLTGSYDPAHVYAWQNPSPSGWLLLTIGSTPTSGDMIPVANGMWVFVTATTATLTP